MSEALALDTKDYVTKALKTAQEATGHRWAWCWRDPKHWALVAQHVIQKPSSIVDFMAKHDITKNFYHDVQNELLLDEECREIRNAWGSEVSAILFGGLDDHRFMQEKFSKSIRKDGYEVDEKKLFMHSKQLATFNDIHGKLTGNNIQKHVVEHIVSQEEYESKADELKAKIAKAKAAKEAEVIEID